MARARPAANPGRRFRYQSARASTRCSWATRAWRTWRRSPPRVHQQRPSVAGLVQRRLARLSASGSRLARGGRRLCPAGGDGRRRSDHRGEAGAVAHRANRRIDHATARVFQPAPCAGKAIQPHPARSGLVERHDGQCAFGPVRTFRPLGWPGDDYLGRQPRRWPVLRHGRHVRPRFRPVERRFHRQCSLRSQPPHRGLDGREDDRLGRFRFGGLSQQRRPIPTRSAALAARFSQRSPGGAR